MKSIQDLREERTRLLVECRALVDGHPGSQWKSEHQRKYDGILARLGEIEGEVGEMERDADRMARGGRAATDAKPGDWINAETGEVIPVAYASRGRLSAQLRDSFKAAPGAGSKIGVSEFLRGIAQMKTRPEIMDALSEGTDSSGGYTVPAEVQLDILDAMAPVSSLLTAGTGIATLDQGAKNYRIAAVSTIPTAGWRSESGAVATSDPAFRAVDVKPQSLAFQFKVSRELLMDGINVEQACRRVIAQAFSKELDRAGLRGTGTPPEIKGIKNIAGIQSVTNGAAGTSIQTTRWQNFISAASAIRQADGPMPNAAIMSPRSLFNLVNCLDGTGQPIRMPPLVEPWKMIDSSQVPNNLTVGASNDCSEIYVGDFSTTSFFLRESMSILRANELNAGTGEVTFFCHVRADFAAMYPAALALVTGVRP